MICINKYFKQYALITLLIISITACERSIIQGSGNVITDTKNIKEFHEVKLFGNFDVILQSSKQYSYQISIDDNILPYIKTKYKDEILEIRQDKNIKLNSNTKTQLIISSDYIKNLAAGGSMNINANNMQSKSLNIDTAGNIKLFANDISVKKIIVNTAGNSNIVLTGNTETAEMNIAGRTDLDAKQLKTKKLEMSVAGYTNAKIYATDYLEISAAGKNDLIYYGNPKKIENNAIGFSNIINGNQSTD